MDGPAPYRPRPVADAPLAALADGSAIAKAWLLTLVADAPLERVAALPAGDLARGGPALCAAIVEALASDAALERLATGDRVALASLGGRFAGARDAVATAAAVEALRRAATAALRPHLAGVGAAVVADVADRLAHVCAIVAGASLALPHNDPPGRDGPLADVLTATREAGEARRPAEEDRPATVHALRTAAPEEPRIEAIWRGAIERRLEKRAADGLPFGLLVAEVDDLDRLLAAQTGREVAIALEAAERAITAEMAVADVIVRERLGRWWLTSGGRDAEATRELAARVAAAIARTRTSGIPFEPSVGIAVCPDHGADVDSLAGQAEQGLFTARAMGLRLS